MATVLTQDAVLHFLRSSGGSVKNSDLLAHFRNFIRDHEDRNRNRELFKKFVNSVATVRQEDGVSVVVLRKQFRDSNPPQVREPPPQRSHPGPKPQPHAPAAETAWRTVLPAAGIAVNNNNNNNNNQVETKTQQKAPSPSERPVQDQGTRLGSGPPHGITPVAPPTRHVPVVPVPPTHQGRQALGSEGSCAPPRIRYRPSYKSAMSCDEEEEEEEEDVPVRQSSGGAMWPVSGPLPARFSVTSPSSSSAERQAPKIFVQDVEWEDGSGLEALPGGSAPTRRSLPPKATPHQDVRSGQPAAVQAPVESVSSRLSSSSPLAPDARFSDGDWPPSGSSHKETKTAETVPHIDALLQRAQGTVLGSADSKTATSPWQPSAGGLDDDQGSAARVQLSTAETVPRIEDALQRAQGAKMASATQPADGETPGSAWRDDREPAARALHLSTGDLLAERDDVESSDGSTSAPRLRQHLALPRRLSREVRSRMCRSLGTDLDQIIQEDMVGGSEAARLNRIHLISSSLSLRGNLSSSLSSCSTPPRCHSLAELDERAEPKGGRRSLPASASSSANHQEAHGGRQSLVPLEPREHSWYVKAAAGAWPDVYSLFRDDPSLLNKHDFISGFTVLHWIAKHGDHRVLNTLWYGVQKLGLTFSVNARTLCGYTPLHIAAIHGSKNILRLLVKNFGADVKLRDVAGKRPWQYLSGAMTPDIFQLLGAPARAALQGTGMLEQQQQQQRRRLHHLSSASSGERPLMVAGVPKVKRSTSLAAFLKHKSLLPFHGQQSGTVLF